jgi:two-component system, cell cycle sensor histidine kinase and response regulator CckA
MKSLALGEVRTTLDAPVEQLLHAVMENAPDFIIVTSADLEARIQYINRLAPGFEMKHVLGAPALDFFPPESRKRALESIETVLATGGPASYEIRAAGPHGAITDYYTRIAPITEAGQIRAILIIASDLTPLKSAERSLRESEEKLRIAVAATSMGIWSWDLGSEEVIWDERMYTIFGRPQRERIRVEDAIASVHPDDRSRAEEQAARTRESGVFSDFECRIVQPDGEIRWILAMGTMHTDASGTARLLGGVLDMTDRRRLEEQLLLAQKMESIGRLAGGIAHDFNNLLTAIVGYTSLVSQQLPSESEMRQDLDRALAASARATRLTQQLLAVGRRQIITPRATNLNEVVRGSTELIEHVIGENYTLEIALDDRLWPVMIDRGQFEQVITNLVLNARDAMSEGGVIRIVTDNVTIVGHPEIPRGDYVRFAVTDRGAGIAEEIRGQVFEPFFTTKGKGKGTGLGLAIVRGVVEQNRGHVLFESAPGEGTTFSVFVPRALSEVEPHAATFRKPPAGTETILLVEDDLLVRPLAVRMLAQLGYRVFEASSGEEALALASRHEQEIDLLVTDVVMPDMSGPRLAELLLKERSKLRILFVSGYTEEAIVRHGVLEKGVHFLHKPYEAASLARRVREVLDA